MVEHVDEGRWIDLDNGEVRVVTTRRGGLEVSVLAGPDDDRVAHDMSPEDARRLLNWLGEVLDGPCPCGGEGWVDDENWQPEFPRQKRVRWNGIIPCGFCNEDGERG